MDSGKTIGRIYSDRAMIKFYIEDFLHDYAQEIASVNFKMNQVEMRNGDKVHFIAIRTPQQCNNIAGFQFNKIFVHPYVDEDTRQYLRSRLRSPFGEVDTDLILMED